jgi:serine/threonine protein kinase
MTNSYLRPGIIRREIAPSSIMITRQAIVKITDFGSARIAGRADGEKVSALWYMSPEQE